MSDTLVALALGVGVGVGAAVPPGPVNLEIARRVPSGGFAAGAAVGLGAVTVDLAYALLLVGGVLKVLAGFTTVRLIIDAAGVVLLTYLGVGALRSASSAGHAVADATSAPARRPTAAGGYAAGVLLCVTSPYQAAFWLTGVPAVMGGNAAADAARAWVVAGVFAATLAWVASWAGLVTTLTSGGRGARLAWWTDVSGGLVLLAFALLAARGVATTLTA